MECSNWSLLQKVALSFDVGEFDDEEGEGEGELSDSNSPNDEHTQCVAGMASCFTVSVT